MVETDVHFPTNINLLWDSMRKMITRIALIFSDLGLTDWRQSDYILRKIKKLFRKASKLKRSKNQAESIIGNQTYIDSAMGYVLRTRQDIEILRAMGYENILRLAAVEQYITHAERQIDPIRRLAINDETIPHREKVFSIFEPHTEWISKGKAGVPQELGLKVCILEDQHSFILHHQVMRKQTDDQVAVEMVSTAKKKFPQLSGCSLDKGFHSPANQTKLPGIICPSKISQPLLRANSLNICPRYFRSWPY